MERTGREGRIQRPFRHRRVLYHKLLHFALYLLGQSLDLLLYCRALRRPCAVLSCRILGAAFHLSRFIFGPWRVCHSLRQRFRLTVQQNRFAVRPTSKGRQCGFFAHWEGNVRFRSVYRQIAMENACQIGACFWSPRALHDAIRCARRLHRVRVRSSGDARGGIRQHPVRRLAYPAAPWNAYVHSPVGGTECTGVRQVLTDETFSAPAGQTRDDVLRMIGPPSETMYFARLGRIRGIPLPRYLGLPGFLLVNFDSTAWS